MGTRTAWVLVFGAAGLLAGCENKGVKIADKTNEIMLKKIDDGKVKDVITMHLATLDAISEAAKQLGYGDDPKITESQAKELNEKVKEFKEVWKKRIDRKWGKKTG